ncbi:MAG: hypothetical protein QM791_12010 [Ferruginibacter sp.]
MWPFNKKKQIPAAIGTEITSIICIPGSWDSWEEFVVKIFGVTNGEYIVAGSILLNIKSNRSYAIEFCERDEKMMETFRNAGLVNNLSESFLEEIHLHKYVIYISGVTGDLESAGHISGAALMILNTGGIGIKIETAGKAFSKEQWINLAGKKTDQDYYQMFVIDSIINEGGEVYSCGMHNLGLMDTKVTGEDFQDAVCLIKVFNYYQVIDKPSIQNNQTFRADTESPIFKITEELNQPYKGLERFENPFGMWKLERI